MALPTNTLRPGKWSLHRTAKGAPVGGDPSMDADNPPRRGLLCTKGYSTVLLRPVFTGGASPTVDVQIVGWDDDTDTFAILDTKAGLAEGVAYEAKCYGQHVYVRITGTANNPTQVDLRVSPGAPALNG
jgi:hypothetical protein